MVDCQKLNHTSALPFPTGVVLVPGQDKGEDGFITDEPRVSPYRLAMHLTTAFVIYGLLTWTTLSLWQPTRFLEGMQDSTLLQRKWLGV